MTRRTPIATRDHVAVGASQPELCRYKDEAK